MSQSSKQEASVIQAAFLGASLDGRRWGVQVMVSSSVTLGQELQSLPGRSLTSHQHILHLFLYLFLNARPIDNHEFFSLPVRDIQELSHVVLN